ncbi:GNAT family N-acetyltransferase [Aliiglaciecola sp. LCG003]|uniref:GNAT family N-acetyltransferase n=1 Tax=Aliiglaciecola sp. LCG003 TaxID=3053655 RepID=UPI002572E9B7|nr:GNAT family N-acetyltransferase [Aliiglaciecola sp. LCG003]WJG10954.1 GNAT family N-acetyltransferase [Aliiglaciecola sp. LCG003]
MNNNLSVYEAKTDTQIQQCCVVLHQLRTEYSVAQIKQSVLAQMQEGYLLLCAKYNDEVAGVGGFRLSRNLAWGKFLYIDDLIVSSEVRSAGIGAKMLEWLSDYAEANQCQQIHLDSGVQRFAAHKFYLNKGFHISSHHFTKKL